MVLYFVFGHRMSVTLVDAKIRLVVVMNQTLHRLIKLCFFIIILFKKFSYDEEKKEDVRKFA